MNRWIKFIGALFTSLTGLACLIIIAMVAIILGNIVMHGYPRLSWEFIAGEPRAGMTEGGIFPAIFGTVALVLLMTGDFATLAQIGSTLFGSLGSIF